MTNREIAGVLFNISTILSEHRGNPYRIRAYRKAARNILRARHSLAERAAAGEPLGIPFLGKRLTTKITQLAKDGRSDFYDELCSDLPPAEQALLKVPGIGPKLAQRVAKDLRADDDLLRRAATVGLQQVWGIGPKRAAAILKGLAIETPADQSGQPTVVRDGNVLYVQERLWREGVDALNDQGETHGAHQEAA
jgi:DNA polymerase/3'-5' exonuclease PolX